MSVWNTLKFLFLLLIVAQMLFLIVFHDNPSQIVVAATKSLNESDETADRYISHPWINDPECQHFTVQVG